MNVGYFRNYPEAITASVEGNPRDMMETCVGIWQPVKWMDKNISFLKSEKNSDFVLKWPCIQLLLEFQQHPDQKTTCSKGQKQILKNLTKLYHNRSTADVTFVVKNLEFKAHSAVITLASPVFAAMFKQDFEESHSKRVVIEDMEPRIFEELLEFLYKGVTLTSHSEALFQAADKYQIDVLKEECEDGLIADLRTQRFYVRMVCSYMKKEGKKEYNLPETISLTEKALDTVVLAHLHSAPKMLKASVEMLLDLKEDVWANPKWKELARCYPDLFFLIAQRLSEHCRRCDHC